MCGPLVKVFGVSTPRFEDQTPLVACPCGLARVADLGGPAAWWDAYVAVTPLVRSFSIKRVLIFFLNCSKLTLFSCQINTFQLFNQHFCVDEPHESVDFDVQINIILLCNVQINKKINKKINIFLLFWTLIFLLVIVFLQNTHLTVCPSGSHINHGSHSFVSFLRLSILARCCT